MALDDLYNYAECLIKEGMRFYQALEKAVSHFYPNINEEERDILISELDDYFTVHAKVEV